MFTLFHHSFCPHSRFIRLALGEHGLDVRLVEERVWERREAFLALNPAGTTPVLMSEGRPAIPGAGIIAEYLDETYGAEHRRPPAVAVRDGGAHRSAPADGVVQREILRGGLQSAGHRAHLQALHERGKRRRRAGGRCDSRGQGQCALSSGLYRLAGADAELPGRRPADLSRTSPPRRIFRRSIIWATCHGSRTTRQRRGTRG